jgi:Flp pilus assembly protein TadG
MIIRPQQSNRRRAASIVEFAVVGPIFFLLMLGVLEYARFLFTMQLVNNAAREGARYAVVNTTTDTTVGVQTYVDNYLAGQGSSQYVGYSKTSNITVYLADPVTGQNTGLSWQNAGWGNGIGVSVTGTYQPIVPGLLHLASSITLTGTCVMTVEAN